MSNEDKEMSMEEILASIRRYVSDETPELNQESVEYVSGKTADVIRLTEVLDDRASNFTPYVKETNQEAAPVHQHYGHSENQTLHIQQPSQSQVPPHQPQMSMHQQAYQNQQMQEPYFAPIPPQQQAMSQPIYESSAPIQAPPGIFSDPTLHTTEKAFSKLTQAFKYAQEEKRASKEQSSIYGSSAIESFVIEMARPMIRQWVDQNLPQLVDRLVTQEIEKLTNDLRKKLL